MAHFSEATMARGVGFEGQGLDAMDEKQQGVGAIVRANIDKQLWGFRRFEKCLIGILYLRFMTDYG
jgi:hypothetical protein